MNPACSLLWVLQEQTWVWLHPPTFALQEGLVPFLLHAGPGQRWQRAGPREVGASCRVPCRVGPHASPGTGSGAWDGNTALPPGMMRAVRNKSRHRRVVAGSGGFGRGGGGVSAWGGLVPMPPLWVPPTQPAAREEQQHRQPAGQRRHRHPAARLRHGLPSLPSPGHQHLQAEAVQRGRARLLPGEPAGVSPALGGWGETLSINGRYLSKAPGAGPCWSPACGGPGACGACVPVVLKQRMGRVEARCPGVVRTARGWRRAALQPLFVVRRTT